MVDKKKVFQEGVNKCETYFDVINMFNALNKELGKDGYYRFQKELEDIDGNSVPGFVYRGYTTGIGLRQILDNLGIGYIAHIISGTGVNKESEILIKPEFVTTLLDIYEKVGMMQSGQQIEVNSKLEKAAIHLYKPIKKR